MRRHTSTRGFTLIEILISVGVIAILVAVSAAAFSTFMKKDGVVGGSAALAAAIRDARARTLASVEGSRYGVKIDSDRFTVFKGAAYSAENADSPFLFARGVVASTSIPVIVFTRLTGLPSASGIIDVQLSSDPDHRETVRVEGTGLVEVVK